MASTRLWPEIFWNSWKTTRNLCNSKEIFTNIINLKDKPWLFYYTYNGLDLKHFLVLLPTVAKNLLFAISIDLMRCKNLHERWTLRTCLLLLGWGTMVSPTGTQWLKNDLDAGKAQSELLSMMHFHKTYIINSLNSFANRKLLELKYKS